MIAKITFYVMVGEEQYLVNTTFTAPAQPSRLFERVLKTYVTYGFGVNMEDCVVSWDSPTKVAVLIKRNYRGPILSGFTKLSEQDYFVDPEGWETVSTSEYSETNMSCSVSGSKKRKATEEDTQYSKAVDVPSKRIRLSGDVVTQGHAIVNAMRALGNGPMTCQDIFDYLVKKNLLQIYNVDEAKPEAFSQRHFVTESSTNTAYKSRIACWLNRNHNVSQVRVGSRNVYTLLQ